MAGTAHADECATDEDCPIGFACEAIDVTCADAPPCLPGEDCEEPPPCPDDEELACVPSPTACTSDSDCSGDWACMTFTYEECWGESTTDPEPVPPEPGGDPGEEPDDRPGEPEPDPDGGSDSDEGEGHGDDPDEGDWECETVSESYCAPPYAGECESDSDCGEGFACTEIEECACAGSGSSGSSGSSGGSIPTPAPAPDDPGSEDAPDGEEKDGHGDEGWEDDCECTGSGSFYCELIEMECDSDSDCPDDWTCSDWGVSVSVPCWEDEDGEVICEDVEEERYSRCEPPGYGAWGGVGGADFDEATRDATNTAAGEESGSLPFAPASDDPAKSGCSSSPGPAPLTGLLALLGVVTLRRRR